MVTGLSHLDAVKNKNNPGRWVISPARGDFAFAGRQVAGSRSIDARAGGSPATRFGCSRITGCDPGPVRSLRRGRARVSTSLASGPAVTNRAHKSRRFARPHESYGRSYPGVQEALVMA